MAANKKNKSYAPNKFAAISVLLAVICFPVSLFSQDSDVSGTVRDAVGNPLADVRVYGMYHFPSGGSVPRDAKTDAQGRFKLNNVGRVIFFVAAKYEPATQLRRADEASIEVTLKPTIESHWPKTCPAVEESEGKRYGTMFLFLVPSGTKTEHYSGTDTWDLTIKFPHSKAKERLLLWSGPMLGGSFVDEETVLNAKSFTQHGFDWRGKDQNDKSWRYYSSSQDLMHYENASDEAAHFFDRIIDSACVRNYDK